MENNIKNLASLANELVDFIQSSVPTSSKLSKYGGTIFTLEPAEKEGQFCGVFIYSKHVQLSFSNGSQLNDTRKILQGSGKYRRHVNLKINDKIDYEYLKDLIHQAAGS